MRAIIRRIWPKTSPQLLDRIVQPPGGGKSSLSSVKDAKATWQPKGCWITMLTETFFSVLQHLLKHNGVSHPGGRTLSEETNMLRSACVKRFTFLANFVRVNAWGTRRKDRPGPFLFFFFFTLKLTALLGLNLNIFPRGVVEKKCDLALSSIFFIKQETNVWQLGLGRLTYSFS